MVAVYALLGIVIIFFLVLTGNTIGDSSTPWEFKNLFVERFWLAENTLELLILDSVMVLMLGALAYFLTSATGNKHYPLMVKYATACAVTQGALRHISEVWKIIAG